MDDHDNKPFAKLCLGCGQPLTKDDGFCRECVDRGLGPCAGCEGRSLADVEEDEQ